MRAPQGQSRLGWASVGAAALAAAAGALLWSAAPRNESHAADSPATVTTPPTAAAALPVSRKDPTPPLPAPDITSEPVQSLAPPPAERRVARPRVPAGTTPTSFAALDLTLVEPSGSPARGIKLTVRALNSRWRAYELPGYCIENHFVLTDLPADTTLVLRGTDPLGYEVLKLQLALSQNERRVLTETVSRELLAVTVHVRDRAGRPVEDASVSLVAGLTQGSTRTRQTAQEKTGSSGVVLFRDLAAESVSVSVQRDGFAPAWVADTPLDRDPLEIAITLDGGFAVDVEIVDEAGRPRGVDAVSLRGSPVSILAERTGPGHYRFAAFPEGASGIIASVQGRVWALDHAARQPVARLLVPSSGSLAVTWDPVASGCEPLGLFIYSEPPGWGWFEAMDAAARARRGPVLFEDLAPGDYRVELHCPDRIADDRTARASVRSGERSEVRIGP